MSRKFELFANAPCNTSVTTAFSLHVERRYLILSPAFAVRAAQEPSVSSDCRNWISFPHHGQNWTWLESRPVRPLLLGKMRTSPLPFGLSTNVPNDAWSFLEQIFTCARVALFISRFARNVNHCFTSVPYDAPIAFPGAVLEFADVARNLIKCSSSSYS